FCCTSLIPIRARVFYSGVGSGRRHIGPPGRSQSCVSLRSYGMRGKFAVYDQRRQELIRTQYRDLDERYLVADLA
uniref:YDG domain-containing protein n=1 Tax=Mesocestoides corti TaxID=53468 RepID=A0A5K3FPZ3_MESCO